MELFKTATESGYASNKDVCFKKIDSIYIKKFRTMENRTIQLGRNITLISGKNGTMKSSILGLIAHPFSSPNDAKDIFGHDLKTPMSQVFKMSLEKDTIQYQYYLNATSSTEIQFSEPIRMYPRQKEKRHRITVGKDNKLGLGNFSLNTAYINLKRLFPIIDTNANVIDQPAFTESERHKISTAYMKIMTRDAFTEFDCISDYKEKNTLGPKNASYDFNSISSGEDNLGNILMKMLAFEKAKTPENILQGIFCIDEIEASLHPVALRNLFDYLLNWSKENNVQIVATTHSLYLIDYVLKYQNTHESHKEEVCFNLISTAMVGADNNYRVLNNPSYKDAYKELTLKNPDEFSLYKINILCEDETAEQLIKKIIKSRSILKNIEFISNVSGDVGTPYSSLVALGKNGFKLLEDSIIVFDSDVPRAELQKVTSKNVDAFIIPDDSNISTTNTGFPIEKDIVKFISELDGSHEIFQKYKEKMAFLDDFHHYEIMENEIPTTNTTKFKNWKNNNKKIYNSILVVYVKEKKDIFTDFRKNLLSAVNKKRNTKGLPLLSL
jgi:AAA15 family ATPase/GTPase